MITTTLTDGRLKHKLDNWTGYQTPGEPISKTKWYRDDFKYHTINGYSVIKDNVGRVTCTCKGYYFRKNCRHTKEILNGV